MAEPENVQTDPATSTTPPAVGDGVVVDESNVTNGPGMPTKKRRGASRLFRGLQHVSSSPSLSRAGRARSASSPYSLSGTLSCVSLASTSSPFGQPSTGSYFSQSSAAGNWSPGTSIPATPIPELISRGNHEEMPAARPVDGTAQMGSTTATLPATVKRKAKSFSLWHSMPHELKIYILSFLRPKELVRASRVSKEFHDMCFDGQLWARLDASAFYKDITAEALEKIVVRAGPFVKDLNLRGCVQVEHYQKTEAMVDACQNLVNVTLEGCRNLKRATLHRLLQTNPKLAYLNLTGLPAVTNTTCSIIAQSCPQLEVLNLSWCKHADARGIKDIVTSCTRLRDLRAGEIKGFDKPDVAEAIFHRGSDTLERLVLAGCDDLSDRALGIMLHGRSPDIDLLTGIPVVPPRKLRHLDLSRCTNLTERGIRALAHLVPDLQGLQLSGVVHLRDEGLAPVLATVPRLTHLELEDCAELTNDLLAKHLAKAPCAPVLEHLGIGYCENLGDAGVLPVLRACKSLKLVVMDNTRISDLALAEAAAMVRERSAARPPPATTAGKASSSSTKPIVTLTLVVYDCANVTWTGIREVLSRNADPPPPPLQPATTTTQTVQKEVIALKCYHPHQQTVDEHLKRVLRGDAAAARRLERKWAEYMQAVAEAEAGGSNAAAVRRRRRRMREAREAANAAVGNAGGGGGGTAAASAGEAVGGGAGGGEQGGEGAGGVGGGGNGAGNGGAAGGGGNGVGRRRARTISCAVM